MTFWQALGTRVVVTLFQFTHSGFDYKQVPGLCTLMHRTVHLGMLLDQEGAKATYLCIPLWHILDSTNLVRAYLLALDDRAPVHS